MDKLKLIRKLYNKGKLEFKNARALHLKEVDKYGKLKNVNYDINKRWEKGIPHHPRSEKLYIKIAEIDWLFNDDQFCWKSGGDGDNGESFMYLLDIINDEMDQREKVGE